MCLNCMAIYAVEIVTTISDKLTVWRATLQWMCYSDKPGVLQVLDEGVMDELVLW